MLPHSQRVFIRHRKVWRVFFDATNAVGTPLALCEGPRLFAPALVANGILANRLPTATVG